MEPAEEGDAAGRGESRRCWRTCICTGSTSCFIGPKGRPNGRMPSWCVMPMILWCWRATDGTRKPIELIESRLEGKFQLEINREKTRVVNLREEGASLDFLGYTFRYDRDLKGRGRQVPECDSVEEGGPNGSGRSCTR